MSRAPDPHLQTAAWRSAAADLCPLAAGAAVAVPVTEAPALRQDVAFARPGLPILVGLDASGGLPDDVEAALFDILVTAADNPPRPWVGAQGKPLDEIVSRLHAAAAATPVAAATLAAVLRTAEPLAFEPALTVESLAYSTLLGGAEFRAWRAANPPRHREDGGPPIRLERHGERLTVTLHRPHVRNAIDAAMRDALSEALLLALADEALAVDLRGEGPSFSAGGDLSEFGTAPDLAEAHIIRSLRAPALLMHRLGRRAAAHVHGACIGGGLEIAAAATRVTASSNVWFRLPELVMGLIPGAGGTVSLPRRIGRHRTCYLALSGEPLTATAALAWGLIDELVLA